MFNFLKKKRLPEALVAPVKGKLIPITSVSDEVFSNKMVGDGFAVEPEDGNIVAPAAGKITSVFPTKHALGITTGDGLEVMLHLGLDTVDLKGAPFSITAETGQTVKAGDSLGTMSIKVITDNGLDPVVMVIVTNMDRVADFPTDTISTENVNAGEEVITVKAKPTDD